MEPVPWRGLAQLSVSTRDLSAPFDTALAPTSTIRESWGHARIGGADHETAGWRFFASIPFTVARLISTTGSAAGSDQDRSHHHVPMPTKYTAKR